MRLKGRAALITGSSSGIGRATAVRFAQEGAQVAINGRDQSRCNAVAEGIRADGGVAISVPADITKPDNVEAMVKETLAAFGKLDILVANAGACEATPFAEMTFAQFSDMMASNVSSLFHCCKRVVPVMREAGYGRIVVVSSLSALRGDAAFAHYSAAKAAQIGLARALARELITEGITVNVVAPGLTATPMTEEVGALPEYLPPMGRIGTTEDQAYAILNFATEQAAFVTGEILSPSGMVY